MVDFEIPKRYGLRQTIADTLGIGGIMRGLRTIPVLLDVCRDMEELCPDALLLSYVNPMAMLCWAVAGRARSAPSGSATASSTRPASWPRDLGVPAEEIDYHVAGINHMAFYLRFERDGEDLYPALLRVLEEDRVPDWQPRPLRDVPPLGYFVTESSEHFAEYVPWFIKPDRPDLIERFNIPLDEYPRRCERQIAEWDGTARPSCRARRRPSASSAAPSTARTSSTRARPATPFAFNGNVPNTGDGDGLLIDNLPADCCVEVPCVARPRHRAEPVGALPRQLAALMQTNINVQGLTVEAALTGRREHVYHAAMLDPHTAAELTWTRSAQLVDDLLEAHGEWIPPLVRALRPA